MSATVLPELAAESVETAERLVRLSAEEDLDSAEADYILASGLAAIQRLPTLWPIIRRWIGSGTSGLKAQQLLARFLDAVDRHLSLAGMLKESPSLVGEEGREVASLTELTVAEEQLLEIRGKVVHLLRVVDAPARWPGDEQLQKAKERMRSGERLTADEFHRVLLAD